MKCGSARAIEVCLSAALLALIALSAAPLLQAQEITAAVTGTVTDPSGAVVPSVHVTDSNLLRGTTWTTETNSAGIYNFPRLPVGNYTIKVKAEDLATIVLQEFVLQMNQADD